MEIWSRWSARNVNQSTYKPAESCDYDIPTKETANFRRVAFQAILPVIGARSGRDRRPEPRCRWALSITSYSWWQTTWFPWRIVRSGQQSLSLSVKVCLFEMFQIIDQQERHLRATGCTRVGLRSWYHILGREIDRLRRSAQTDSISSEREMVMASDSRQRPLCLTAWRSLFKRNHNNAR